MVTGKIEDYDSKDFIEIQKGVIVWLGYYYDVGSDESEPWRRWEYSGFQTSIADFVHKYRNDPGAAYEAVGQLCNIYIGDLTHDEAQEEFDEYAKHYTAVKAEDIVEGFPDGNYILV